MGRARETSPYCYAIEYAASTTQVFATVAQLVAELERSNVVALLPVELRNLTLGSLAQIDTWLAALQRIRAEKLPLSACARLWVEEIEAVFEVAHHRLEQLEAQSGGTRVGREYEPALNSLPHISKPGPTPGKPRQQTR